MTEPLNLKEAEARLRDILRLTTADAVERNRLALALLRALQEALWVIYHAPYEDIRPADLREWQNRRAEILRLVP